jgi:hypothetical protein
MSATKRAGNIVHRFAALPAIPDLRSLSGREVDSSSFFHEQHSFSMTENQSVALTS